RQRVGAPLASARTAHRTARGFAERVARTLLAGRRDTGSPIGLGELSRRAPSPHFRELRSVGASGWCRTTRSAQLAPPPMRLQPPPRKPTAAAQRGSKVHPQRRGELQLGGPPVQHPYTGPVSQPSAT